MSNIIVQKKIIKMNIVDLIREKLQALEPSKLEVIDVSYKHKGHKNYIEDKATHFDVFIVSDSFINTVRVQRHKKVMSLLKNELKNEIHALSLKTITNQEYKDYDPNNKSGQ